MIKILHMVVKKEDSIQDSIRLVDKNLYNKYDEDVTHMRCININYTEDICFDKLSGYDIKNIIALRIGKNKDVFSKECLNYINKLNPYELQNEISTNKIIHNYLKR
jgi:hypothetical protein